METYKKERSPILFSFFPCYTLFFTNWIILGITVCEPRQAHIDGIHRLNYYWAKDIDGVHLSRNSRRCSVIPASCHLCLFLLHHQKTTTYHHFRRHPQSRPCLHLLSLLHPSRCFHLLLRSTTTARVAQNARNESAFFLWMTTKSTFKSCPVHWEHTCQIWYTTLKQQEVAQEHLSYSSSKPLTSSCSISICRD